MFSWSADASAWTRLPPCGEIMNCTFFALKIRLALNYMLPVILRSARAQTGPKHSEHATLLNVPATKTSPLWPAVPAYQRVIVFRCRSLRAFSNAVNASAAKTQFHLMSLPCAPLFMPLLWVNTFVPALTRNTFVSEARVCEWSVLPASVASLCHLIIKQAWLSPWRRLHASQYSIDILYGGTLGQYGVCVLPS